jgi:predicted nucleic acid-binding protein
VNVLVDTSIWSIAFRRKNQAESVQLIPLVSELAELVNEDRVVLIGPVRQEVLSGISNPKQFKLLKERLKPFEDLPILREDYELAADFYNQCRKNGIQGSHIDFLICAFAHNHRLDIFTTDKDFIQYSKHINISLYKSRLGAPTSVS